MRTRDLHRRPSSGAKHAGNQQSRTAGRAHEKPRQTAQILNPSTRKAVWRLGPVAMLLTVNEEAAMRRSFGSECDGCAILTPRFVARVSKERHSRHAFHQSVEDQP
jgi:hypothetical protein